MAFALVSSFVLLGCASPGSAQFKTPSAASQNAPPAPQTLAPESRSPSTALYKGVEKLVPDGYSVRWLGVDSSRRNTSVTWAEKQSWQLALREAVAAAGLMVDIGDSTHLVLIRQTAPDARPVPIATSATPSRSSAIADLSSGKPIPLDGGLATAASGSTRDSASGRTPATAASGVATGPARWGLTERDKTLKAGIERWAQEAGWRVFWELGVDYRISAAALIGGSFEEAVSVVIRSMAQADVPPAAIFYRGNQVLRVVPRGTE
jgi:hypothetical protein